MDVCRGEWMLPTHTYTWAVSLSSPLCSVGLLSIHSNPCYRAAGNQSPLKDGFFIPPLSAFHLISPNQTCQCEPWQGRYLGTPSVTAFPDGPLHLMGVPRSSGPSYVQHTRLPTVMSEARGQWEGALWWPRPPSPTSASIPGTLPFQSPGERMLAAPPCNSYVQQPPLSPHGPPTPYPVQEQGPS